MNINAKQVLSIDSQNKMDITTALGFFVQMRDKIGADATLTAAMGSVWTTFITALLAYDDAYAQARKWAETADIEKLDDLRDDALSAFLQALKAMLASPNAAKQAGAKTLTFIRDKYTLNRSDEYMKETTAVSQMIQEMETSAEAQAALQTTGLEDWFTDLKAKNEAFLSKMNERTEAQAGQQKGIVREKRLACEAAFRNVVKLINAMAICEVPAGYSFGTIIDLLNAEIEHYRQILARKGVSTGSSSQNGQQSGGDNGQQTGGDNGQQTGGDNGQQTTDNGQQSTDNGQQTSGDNNQGQQTGGDDNPGGGNNDGPIED